MDAIRKQLDVLMGANRNGDVREVNRKYYDRDVCRLYLVGLCPHELFQLTVISLFPFPLSLSLYPHCRLGTLRRRFDSVTLIAFVSENGYGSLPQGPLLAAQERVSFTISQYSTVFLSAYVFHLSLKHSGLGFYIYIVFGVLILRLRPLVAITLQALTLFSLHQLNCL